MPRWAGGGRLIDHKYDDSLTMIGPRNPGLEKVAYENMMAQYSEDMTNVDGQFPQMCWPVDFFPEPMPIENAAGTAIDTYLQKIADPEHCVSQWPPVFFQEAVKEDVLVFSDSYGYCKEILARAPPGRLGVVNVQAKHPKQYTEQDIKKLLTVHSWDVIIFAFGIDPPVSNDLADIHELQNDILKVYLFLLQYIERTGHCKRVVVLTVDAFSDEREVHEENGLGLITHCNLFGMTNTARAEVQIPFQYIDTEWTLSTENTKFIVAEIFRQQSFGMNTVRILNKGRYVQRQVSSKAYEMVPNEIGFRMPDDGTIAITGGNGALGIVMGLWLLSKAQQQINKKFSIKFMSRSMKISDANTPNWKEVESMAKDLGIDVEQIRCDMSSQQACEKFIADVTPNLVGFIHSAGVLQDSMLMNQTWEKFDKVYESKSRAAMFVHEALERYENPRLKYWWVFSSGAVYGNMGQLNYSGSNSMLDGICRHRRALGKPAMAPQWGAWGDVGMATTLDDASRRRMANSPFPYFSNAEGLYGMECLIRSNLAYGAVMKANAPMVFGMVQPDEGANQNYQRNFFSSFAPHYPGDPHKNSYVTVGYTMRTRNQKPHKGLVFQNFWPEAADGLEELDEAS